MSSHAGGGHTRLPSDLRLILPVPARCLCTSGEMSTWVCRPVETSAKACVPQSCSIRTEYIDNFNPCVCLGTHISGSTRCFGRLFLLTNEWCRQCVVSQAGKQTPCLRPHDLCEAGDLPTENPYTTRIRVGDKSWHCIVIVIVLNGARKRTDDDGGGRLELSGLRCGLLHLLCLLHAASLPVWATSAVLLSLHVATPTPLASPPRLPADTRHHHSGARKHARTHHQGSGKRLPLVLTSAASHVSKWQVQPTLKVGSDTRHLEPSRIFIYSTSLPTSTHVPVQFIRGSRGRSMVSGISLFFFLFNRIEHCGAALPMNGMGFLPTGCSHCQPVTWAKLLPARLIHLSHRMK